MSSEIAPPRMSPVARKRTHLEAQLARVDRSIANLDKNDCTAMTKYEGRRDALLRNLEHLRNTCLHPKAGRKPGDFSRIPPKEFCPDCHHPGEK